MNSTLPYGGGYADIHVGLPMRRAILTEVAEVRGRRDQRKRLLGMVEPRAKRDGVASAAAALAENRRVRLEGDREHLRSLMRLLHILRGDAR